MSRNPFIRLIVFDIINFQLLSATLLNYVPTFNRITRSARLKTFHGEVRCDRIFLCVGPTWSVKVVLMVCLHKTTPSSPMGIQVVDRVVYVHGGFYLELSKIKRKIIRL